MDKRQRILDAAIKLFNQNGFDNTPTALITKEASVATGTLFNYFTTKEELINQLYLECKDSLKANLIIGTGEEVTFRSKLKRIYTNFLAWSIEHNEKFFFFQQFSNSPYIGDATRSEGMSRFNDFIHLINDGIEQEIIKNIGIEYLGILIAGICTSNAYYYIANPALQNDANFIDTSYGCIWDSIRK